MTAAELAEQLASPDSNRRSRALAELIRLGRPASIVLRPLLTQVETPLRALAAQALAEIGNPDDAEIFANALHDPEPAVRARAAQGLAAIGDDRAVTALLHTLNDLPDVLHHPATLATHLLTGLGPRALPGLAPLLKSADAETRRRAWLAIHGIVANLPEAGDWRRLWQSLGSYHPDAPVSECNVAADLWADWIARNATRPARE
jgi:HEAT repeat protein